MCFEQLLTLPTNSDVREFVCIFFFVRIPFAVVVTRHLCTLQQWKWPIEFRPNEFSVPFFFFSSNWFCLHESPANGQWRNWCIPSTSRRMVIAVLAAVLRHFFPFPLSMFNSTLFHRSAFSKIQTKSRVVDSLRNHLCRHWHASSASV